VGVGAVGASGAVDDQVARALVAPDDNVEMIEQLARQPRNRDRAVFVGNLDDDVDDTFGPGLPVIHDCSDFAGHVTGFNPPPWADVRGGATILEPDLTSDSA
jgi:hypothetical protein